MEILTLKTESLPCHTTYFQKLIKWAAIKSKECKLPCQKSTSIKLTKKRYENYHYIIPIMSLKQTRIHTSLLAVFSHSNYCWPRAVWSISLVKLINRNYSITIWYYLGKNENIVYWSILINLLERKEPQKH